MTDEIRRQIISPEVHADRSVTFRVRAPLAKHVAVNGIPGALSLSLSRDSQGIWTATTPPLEPGLHSYLLEIDGLPQIDPSNRYVKKWLSLESMVEVPGDPPALHELTRVPHGALHQHTFASTTTGQERGVYIYTPPEGTEVADHAPTSEPPVLVLLHGYGDDESAWSEVGRVHRIADNLLAQGRIEPTVIVMPHGHPLPIDLKREFDDYADENGQRMEQELLIDLMPFVERRYRVSADPMRRAIAGLSMGGGQALRIGLRHPDHFSVVGGFSSATPYPKPCEGLSYLAADTDAHLAHRLLWIACGDADFLLERNTQFIAELERRGIPHQWQLTAGGHDWTVWRDYVAQFLVAAFPR